MMSLRCADPFRITQNNDIKRLFFCHFLSYPFLTTFLYQHLAYFFWVAIFAFNACNAMAVSFVQFFFFILRPNERYTFIGKILISLQKEAKEKETANCRTYTYTYMDRFVQFIQTFAWFKISLSVTHQMTMSLWICEYVREIEQHQLNCWLILNQNAAVHKIQTHYMNIR